MTPDRRQVRYEFARVTMLGPDPDHTALYWEGLTSGKPQPMGEHRVMICEPHRWTAACDGANSELMSGLLVKYRPFLEQEVVLEQERRIAHADVPGPIVAKSRFILLPEHGLIAFHPGQNKLPSSAFRRHFAAIIMSPSDGFFIEVEVRPLATEGALRYRIGTLDRVRRIYVRLWPSNPNNREVWRPVEERLRRIGAIHATESYSGPDLHVDQPLEARLAMAEDGYGTAVVDGEQDGQMVRVSTEGFTQADQAPDDDAEPEAVFAALRRSFQSIIDRVRGRT